MSDSVNAPTSSGRFDVIDSFAIPRRKEFYLIGRLAEGEIHEGWYAHIPLNSSLVMTIKIARIEHIVKQAQEEYPVLVITAEGEELDLLLSLAIGSETILISPKGSE